MKRPSSFYYFKRKPLNLPDRYDLWRGVADSLDFKTHERLRVEWMIFYFTQAKENATLTAHHFGISRKTFHKWLKRFKDQSKAPYHRRNWEVTLIQEDRVKRLRKKYPYYGKKKLKVLYQREYGEDISTWKIERVIRKHRLYPDRKKAEKTARKRARAHQKPKKRITQLTKDKRPYFLLQLDTIIIY